MALKKQLRHTCQDIYRVCIRASGITTIVLGSLINEKVILSSNWWLGYACLAIGIIVFVGSIISDFKTFPQDIAKLKNKIKKQRITLTERIAQEERHHV